MYSHSSDLRFLNSEIGPSEVYLDQLIELDLPIARIYLNKINDLYAINVSSFHFS